MTDAGATNIHTHTHTMTRWVECSHYFNSMAEAPIEHIQKGPRDMLNTHTHNANSPFHSAVEDGQNVREGWKMER